jgi:hypothetical protein
MGEMADKKKPEKRTPKVHEELKGFEFKIDKFGEITNTKSVEELNKFLNKNVKDKKLKGRKDLEK